MYTCVGDDIEEDVQKGIGLCESVRKALYAEIDRYGNILGLYLIPFAWGGRTTQKISGQNMRDPNSLKRGLIHNWKIKRRFY